MLPFDPLIRRSMLCAMTGVIPENPVVSTRSGHLFERSAVVKAIEATGKCPITGEELSTNDLLPLKAGTSAKPRAVPASSIPGMLSLFQNEWETLMFEISMQKQQLQTVRQELGHALYQHDAACRVIARLIKERDEARIAMTEARTALTETRPSISVVPELVDLQSAAVDCAMTGMTSSIIAAIESTSKALSKGRKKRQPPAEQASAVDMGKLAAKGAVQKLHKKKGAVCIDMHKAKPLLATGGADGVVCVFDCTAAKLLQMISAHQGQVNAVELHPSEPLLLSCANDATMRSWDLQSGEVVHTFNSHSAAIADCTLHATGDYVVTASLDKSWVLSDLRQGCPVLAVGGASSGYSCTAFHPDGLILATGNDKVGLQDGMPLPPTRPHAREALGRCRGSDRPTDRHWRRRLRMHRRCGRGGQGQGRAHGQEGAGARAGGGGRKSGHVGRRRGGQKGE